jgi:TPR repeat protein
MYATGQGVPKDFGKAMEWFEKAADQGNDSGQDSIGDMYYRGEGVPQDYGQAMEWYQKAADQGNDSAQDSLGEMYYLGEGVPKDIGTALGWFKKAAAQGNPDAQSKLDLLTNSTASTSPSTSTPSTSRDDGVTPSVVAAGPGFDDSSSLEAVRQAAKGGDPSAEYQLALRLFNGTARSPADTQLLNDAGIDFFKYFAGHEQILDRHGDHGDVAVDVGNAGELKDSSVVQDFLSKKRALQGVLDAVNKKETEEAVSLLEDSASKNYTPAVDEFTVLEHNGRVLTWKARDITLQSSQSFGIDQAKSFETKKGDGHN